MRNPQWAINLRDFPHNAHARFVDSVTNGKRNMPPWDDALDPDEIEAHQGRARGLTQAIRTRYADVFGSPCSERAIKGSTE
jgi:hypothetical protein